MDKEVTNKREQDERTSVGGERSDISRMKEELSRQMEIAVERGDTKEMEEVQKRMDILQKSQELQHQPQISEEEKGTLGQYEEPLQKEIDDNTSSEFSINDIIKKVKHIKENDYINRMEAIKKDRQGIKEQDIERN